MGGYMSVNSYLEMFGFDDIGPAGEEAGWSSADLEIPWFEFNHEIGKDDEGNDCYIINVDFWPDDDYMREWE